MVENPVAPSSSPWSELQPRPTDDLNLDAEQLAWREGFNAAVALVDRARLQVAQAHQQEMRVLELDRDSWRRCADRVESERLLMRAALGELVALVRGECPSLLNEDSGGNARLSMLIDQALAEGDYEGLSSQLDALRGQLATAHNALLAVEWHDTDGVRATCPLCGARYSDSQHRPDCKIRAALSHRKGATTPK